MGNRVPAAGNHRMTLPQMMRQELCWMYGQEYPRPQRPTFRSIFSEHQRTLMQIIEDETEHQRVMVRMIHDVHADVVRVGAHCQNCEKGFYYAVAGVLQYQSETSLRWLVKEAMVDIVDLAKGCRCFTAGDEALLAEWLTNRLIQAGPGGMPYDQLVHEAAEARLCTPADVSAILRRMNFLEQEMLVPSVILPKGWDGEWTAPIVQLPNGHPMRTW